jgi:hypothetical protein
MRELQQAFQSDTTIGSVFLADPKLGRVTRAKAGWERLGASVIARQAPIEQVLHEGHSGAPTVLAVDSMRPMTEVLERYGDRQTIVAQGVGRGSNLEGRVPAIGLSVLSVPERGEQRREILDLFKGLASISEGQTSSSELRQTGIEAMRLHERRQQAAKWSALRVKELDRSRDEDALAQLFWSSVEPSYPIIVRRAEDPSRLRQQALDASVGRDRTAVALVETGVSVHFLMVNTKRAFRKRPFLRAHVAFERSTSSKEALKAFEARVLLGLRIEPAQAPTLRSSSTDEAITLSVFLETIGGFESIEHVSM